MVAGLGRGDIRVVLFSAAIVAAAGVLHFAEAPALATFAVAAVALAGIAYLIGESTDQLGNHLGPAATGIVQSAVGNLPELFVCIFALRAGLITVVQASLIGSILSNALLVLGLAFVAGGWRFGTLRFGGEAPRMIASLLMLAVAALVLPTFAHELHLPAGEHEQALAVVCAIVLLLVYAISIRAMLTQGERTIPAEAHQHGGGAWPGDRDGGQTQAAAAHPHEPHAAADGGARRGARRAWPVAGAAARNAARQPQRLQQGDARRQDRSRAVGALDGGGGDLWAPGRARRSARAAVGTARARGVTQSQSADQGAPCERIIESPLFSASRALFGSTYHQISAMRNVISLRSGSGGKYVC